MTEKNQSLQRELTIQRKSFAKTQDRSNDTVELLKSENSHLTKSLSLVEKERDQLALETKELQTQFEENLEKLVQVVMAFICIYYAFMSNTVTFEFP